MNVMRFRIYLHEGGDTTTTNPRTHDLGILPADRMRAERASTKELPPSQRGPGAVKANSETWVLLWLWCAATRLGLTSVGFSEWADTVLDYVRLRADGTVADDDDELADDDDELADELGPTRPGALTTGP